MNLLSYQVKVPGTKFTLELVPYEEQWFLQLVIDENVEEELPMTKLTKTHLETSIEEITRIAGFPLNPLQLKNINEEMMEQAQFVIFDDSGTTQETQDNLSDWRAPARTAASVQKRTPVQPTPQVEAAAVRVRTASSAPVQNKSQTSQTLNINELKPIFLKLRKAVSLLDASVEELENLLSK
jgi:hypothetical protein